MDKDYCSFSPDSIFGIYIGDICKIHDEDYAKPDGTYQGRLKVDREFRDRLKDRVGFIVANLYYLGVRLFGWIWWKV